MSALMRDTYRALAVFPLLCACAATPSDRAPESAALRVEPPSPRSSAPAAGSVREAALVASAPPRAQGVGEVELELWNDPEFRRRFAESYLAETEVEPLLTTAEREGLQEVLELISSEQMDAAAQLLEKSRNEASSAVLDFMLGNIHFQREEWEPAAAAYRVAVEKHPKFRRAWKNLGLIHVRRSEFEAAALALTRVIELGGGDAVTYGLLGFAHSSRGDDLSAESAYRMAALLDPDTLDWKMGLARSFFRQKRFAEAVALCGNLLEDQPERTDLWLLQANAFLGQGQPMRAAENYELVERLGRSTPESLTMLGDIYVNAGLQDLAVDAYLRAMDKAPDARPERAIRAAKALTAAGALDEAGRLLAGIERVHGARLEGAERKDLLRLRARLAVAAGAGDEEARALAEIVELDPLDGEALILLGQHAFRAEDPEKAVFYYERAASIEAFEADAKVRHAQLLVQQRRFAEALPLLRRAQVLKPRDNIASYLEDVERAAQAR